MFKQKQLRKVVLACIGVILLVCASLVMHVQAGGASLYIDPAGSTATVGGQFRVALKVNTGGVDAKAVRTVVYYPADYLLLAEVNGNSSAFEHSDYFSQTPGQIVINRSSADAVVNDNNVVFITFKALKAGGGRLTISGDSQLIRRSDNANFLTVINSGTFNIAAPPATPRPATPVPATPRPATPQPPVSTPVPPAPTPQPVTPSPTPDASSSPSPSPTPSDADKVTLSMVSVDDITQTGATISWQTDKPSDSSVVYGESTSYGYEINDDEITTNHVITIEEGKLKPATDYHFMAVSNAPEGQKGESDDSAFHTKGFKVKIVLKSGGKPVSGANVSILGINENFTSNNAGEITLDDASAGKLDIRVEGWNVISGSVDVKSKESADDTQVFTLDIKPVSSGSSGAIVAVVIGLVMIIGGGVAGFILYKRHKAGAGDSGMSGYVNTGLAAGPATVPAGGVLAAAPPVVAPANNATAPLPSAAPAFSVGVDIAPAPSNYVKPPLVDGTWHPAQLQEAPPEDLVDIKLNPVADISPRLVNTDYEVAQPVADSSGAVYYDSSISAVQEAQQAPPLQQPVLKSLQSQPSRQMIGGDESEQVMLSHAPKPISASQDAGAPQAPRVDDVLNAPPAEPDAAPLPPVSLEPLAKPSAPELKEALQEIKHDMNDPDNDGLGAQEIVIDHNKNQPSPPHRPRPKPAGQVDGFSQPFEIAHEPAR